MVCFPVPCLLKATPNTRTDCPLSSSTFTHGSNANTVVGGVVVTFGGFGQGVAGAAIRSVGVELGREGACGAGGGSAERKYY
jgi:hypothetical protein